MSNFRGAMQRTVTERTQMFNSLTRHKGAHMSYCGQPIGQQQRTRDTQLYKRLSWLHMSTHNTFNIIQQLVIDGDYHHFSVNLPIEWVTGKLITEKCYWLFKNWLISISCMYILKSIYRHKSVELNIYLSIIWIVLLKINVYFFIICHNISHSMQDFSFIHFLKFINGNLVIGELIPAWGWYCTLTFLSVDDRKKPE